MAYHRKILRGKYVEHCIQSGAIHGWNILYLARKCHYRGYDVAHHRDDFLGADYQGAHHIPQGRGPCHRLGGRSAAGVRQRKGIGGGGLKGDLMCLTAQTCIGLYMVIFSSMIHRYSVFTLMKWMFLFSAIVVTIITWPYISAIDYASLPLVAWAEILFIVFCGTFLSYVCFTYGQQVLTPTIVGMYNYVQPIVATVLAVAIGVGRFGWREMLSMALVFGGVYIVNRAKNFERARGNK